MSMILSTLELRWVREREEIKVTGHWKQPPKYSYVSAKIIQLIALFLLLEVYIQKFEFYEDKSSTVTVFLINLLDLFLQCCIEELDKQVLFSIILCIVEHSEHNVLQKPVCPALRHLKDQLGKVNGVRLKEVEEMLIGLE